MKYTLYLASSSFSRKRLLELSDIPFSLITQDADESTCSLEQPLESLVQELAELKMDHVALPQGQEGQIAYFLTADTLTMDPQSQLYGKPVDRHDAIRMLQACREGAIVGTAFCLERKLFKDGQWRKQERIVGYDRAWCVVDIPDAFLDFYLDRVPFTDVSGGITIEGFGEQFVKEVNGCYSAILGLPMYKLRDALYKLGFYSF
tara:strand:- start:358 stop:969 length:612 start_codon:yes stop_codon:yes gene_type:complete